MFSSREVDWKRGSSAIACYYSMSILPKDLRGKVNLNPDTDSAMLYSAKSTIWPKNKDLDLGKSSFRKGYKGILFWRNGVLDIQVPIKFRPTSTSPVLNGTMEVGLSVDGDLGASKLVEGVFTSRSEVSELDSGTLVSLVKSSIKGRLNTMLEGLEESNLRDPKARGAANEQAEQHLSALLEETGIVVSGLNMRWSKTGGEKLGQMKKTLDRRKDVMGTKLEEQAIERMRGSKNMEQLEKHRAETIASEFLEEDRTRRDTAKLRRKAEVEEAEQEMELRKRIHESRSKLAETEFQEKVDDLKHLGEMSRKMDNLDLSKVRIDTEISRKQAESDIESDSKDRDVDRIVRAALSMKEVEISEGAIIDLLKPEGEEGRSYDFSEVINPDIHEDLEQGLYTAGEIDGFISELERMTKSPGNSKEKLSDIWAGLGVFHRHRGNKGGSMDEAISRSLQFNEDNTIAMKCRMDYLWNRHPQQFLPGKLERFGDQLMEIESLLEGLLGQEGASESDKSDMMERHRKCLKALSRDKENGDIWKDKMEAKYGLEI
ncbi:MAG: hypothetical protein CXT66_06450 [Methanobacteriota archaeon]|jgi:hypothetical protein|nr:MAG: hypothetical protein CXT66_06450 [Euryarchaeota archaeon]